MGAGRPTLLARDADGLAFKLHPLAIDGAGEALEPRAGGCSCGGAFMLAFFDDDGARLREVPVLLHTEPACEVFRTVDDFPRVWTYLNTGQLPREAAPVPVGVLEAPPKPAKRYHR